MAVVIDSRPIKTISGYESQWNAAGGNLPLVYEMSNFKFPTNIGSPTLVPSSVATDNGRLKITTGAAHGYTAGDYVKLTGDYSGTFRVLFVASTTSFTVNTEFVTGQTVASVQFAYYNYCYEIRVYAGIDPGHPHAAQDPMALIGTFKQIPDSDNIARVDIGAFIKEKLESTYIDSQTSWPNDLNAWTDFYIETREVYTGSNESFVADTETAIKAVNNALQFGNAYGGNLYLYVFDTATYAYDARFLTSFDRGLYFSGQPKSLSIISNVDTFDLTLTPYDGAGNALTPVVTNLTGDGYGVYHLDLSVTDSSAVKFEAVVSSGSATSETFIFDIEPCTA